MVLATSAAMLTLAPVTAPPTLEVPDAPATDGPSNAGSVSDDGLLAGNGDGLADADPSFVVAFEDEADEPVAERAWTARARITGYCTPGIMRSGAYTYSGAVATDRAYIPAGSLIEIEDLPGIYVSEDTGSGVRGWWVDVFWWNCRDAIQWGSRQRAIRVTRWGY